MEASIAARSVPLAGHDTPTFWLGADGRGRVALFEAGPGGAVPVRAAPVTGAALDEALRSEFQMAWLLTRPVVDITASDDLESYEEGQPFVAVLEEIELARQLAARGVARFLAEGPTVRVVLGPNASEEDADQVRSCESYLGSMGFDDDLWLENLSHGDGVRFRASLEAPGQYVKLGGGIGFLTIDQFSVAGRQGIVTLEADFERQAAVGIPDHVVSEPGEGAPAASFSIEAAPPAAVSNTPAVIRVPDPQLSRPDENDEVWTPKRTLRDWLPLVWIGLAVLLIVLLVKFG